MTTLSSLVITRQAATIAQVDEALACQVMKGGDLGTCLLELGAMKEEALLPLLGEAYALPAVAPGPLAPAPPSLLRMVPQAVALTYNLYPIGEVDGELHLAVVEPLPPAVEEDLAFALGAHLKQFAVTSMRVRQALARDYGIVLERRFARLLATIEQGPDPNPTEPPLSDYSSVRPSGLPGPNSVLSLAPRKRTWPGMLAVREGEKGGGERPASPAIPAAPTAPRIEEDFSDLEGESPAEPDPSPEAPIADGVASPSDRGTVLVEPELNPNDFAPTPSVPPVSELSPTPLMPPVTEMLVMATPDSDPPTRFSDVPATLPTGASTSTSDTTSVERRAVGEPRPSRPPYTLPPPPTSS